MDERAYQERIDELENQVFQLSLRLTRLEAERPYMATKADAIRSSWLPHISINIGRGKRKKESGEPWINNDANLLMAIIVAGIIGVFLGSGLTFIMKTLTLLIAQ